jgi:hypothetical protein
MRLLLPPVRSEALAEISTLVVRWIAGFDPFGPSKVPAHNA